MSFAECLSIENTFLDCLDSTDCGPPLAIVNGNVTYPAGSLYRDTAQYECNRGYNRTSGDPQHMCGENSNWIGTLPVCTKYGESDTYNHDDYIDINCLVTHKGPSHWVKIIKQA